MHGRGAYITGNERKVFKTCIIIINAMQNETVPVLPCSCFYKVVVVIFADLFNATDIILEDKPVEILCKQDIAATS